MESTEKDKDALISGIESDAKAEEQKIIQDAKIQAEEKTRYFEKKMESLLEDARKEAQKRVEAIQKTMAARIKLELKRNYMQVQQGVIQEILHDVEQKFNSMIVEKDYKDILAGWITEAVVGLGTDSAVLNATEKERALIDKQMILDVVEKVFSLTGKKVTLQLSDDEPLKLQGVIATAADGRTAYNNQVRTRISRKEREIQMMIYKTLFADGRKEAV